MIVRLGGAAGALLLLGTPLVAATGVLIKGPDRPAPAASGAHLPRSSTEGALAAAPCANCGPSSDDGSHAPTPCGGPEPVTRLDLKTTVQEAGGGAISRRNEVEVSPAVRAVCRRQASRVALP